MSTTITVMYKWTAKDGKLDELTGIYRDVTDAMQANEPGATNVHVYESTADNAIYVRDEFIDADAMGFHLGTTAAAHFPSLLEVATPGPFFFLGDVPEEMQAHAKGMGLAAEFSTHAAGYDR
ncbi:MAG: antibiotic biosynthesis monooxygenase [Actinomycetota bacterium]